MGHATPGLPHEVSDQDLHWLAGLLEGEGSFFPGPPSAPRRPVLQVSMTDEDIVARAGAMFGRKISRWQSPNRQWQPTYFLRVTGAKAVAWMTALRPLVGSRRRMQIDRALASYEPKPSAILDAAAASAALELLASGVAVGKVAEQFGTSIWCIYDLRAGRTHKHLPRP